MSLTKVGIVGKTAARFGVQEIPGRMSIPKIQHDLTAKMLPKSQVPATGRMDPIPPNALIRAVDKVMFPIIKFYYPRSVQCELGLRFDDWYYNQATDKDVGTALSRIDDIDLQLRNFRGLRASQLAIERTVCPEDERWEEVVGEVRYVKPWIEQVRKEKAEADAWDNY